MLFASVKELSGKRTKITQVMAGFENCTAICFSVLGISLQDQQHFPLKAVEVLLGGLEQGVEGVFLYNFMWKNLPVLICAHRFKFFELEFVFLQDVVVSI